MGKFLTLPAKTPGEILGFAIMVIAVLVILHKTGISKRLGV